MVVERQLKAYAEQIDVQLASLIPQESEIPTELHQAMRYSCLAPGKRLRPALCMASAVAVGGSSDSVVNAGCAIEMLHCFSLIHDDLPALDNDELRRGVPTCHVKFGEAVAILAGDALFTLAFSTLADGPWPAEAKVHAIRLLTHASTMLVRGETADLLSEGKPTEPELLQFIHDNKTGALIAASCEIGGRLEGCSEEEARALREYGGKIGLAFQIADDILNEISTPEQLGKAAGSDRERGKATYPALYGLDASLKQALALADEGTAHLSVLKGDVSFLSELALFSVQRLK